MTLYLLLCFLELLRSLQHRIPVPARRLITHEVPEARDRHFIIDVTDTSLR